MSNLYLDIANSVCREINFSKNISLQNIICQAQTKFLSQYDSIYLKIGVCKILFSYLIFYFEVDTICVLILFDGETSLYNYYILMAN